MVSYNFFSKPRTVDGNSALYRAAESGYTQIVQDLIDAGATATMNHIKPQNLPGMVIQEIDF